MSRKLKLTIIATSTVSLLAAGLFLTVNSATISIDAPESVKSIYVDGNKQILEKDKKIKTTIGNHTVTFREAFYQETSQTLSVAPFQTARALISPVLNIEGQGLVKNSLVFTKALAKYSSNSNADELLGSVKHILNDDCYSDLEFQLQDVKDSQTTTTPVAMPTAYLPVIESVLIGSKAGATVTSSLNPVKADENSLESIGFDFVKNNGSWVVANIAYNYAR